MGLINLPSLIQKIIIDTKDMSRASLEAEAFGRSIETDATKVESSNRRINTSLKEVTDGYKENTTAVRKEIDNSTNMQQSLSKLGGEYDKEGVRYTQWLKIHTQGQRELDKPTKIEKFRSQLQGFNELGVIMDNFNNTKLDVSLDSTKLDAQIPLIKLRLEELTRSRDIKLRIEATDALAQLRAIETVMASVEKKAAGDGGGGKKKSGSSADFGVAGVKALATLTPVLIVGIASFLGPAIQVIESLGAASIAVVGGLGQMTSSLGAFSIAAIGNLAPVTGVLAAYPGLLAAVGTGFLGIKAATKGLLPYEAAVAKFGANSKQAQLLYSKMAPEVRTLSKEVNVYVKSIHDMGDIVRQFATPGITLGLKEAAPIFGVLKFGAKGLALEIRALAIDLGKFIGSKGFLKDFHFLAGNNVKVFHELGGALHPIIDLLKNILVAAAPMTLTLATAFNQFAKFLDLKTNNRTSMVAFFANSATQAITLFRSMGDIIGSLITFGSIGSKVFFGKGGVATGVGGLTRELKKWTDSGSGISAITDWFKKMKPIADDSFKAVWNIVTALWNLANTGNDVFFGGGGGMIHGIEVLTEKFKSWSESPSGLKAITGWFAQMKPIAVETMNLIVDVVKGLYGLGNNAGAADLIKSIRTDLLPSIITLLEKMKGYAPTIISTLKGIGDFAATLDPVIILSIANQFSSLVSSVGSLVSLVPGFGQFVSLAVTLFGAKKLFGDILSPAIAFTRGTAAKSAVTGAAKGAESSVVGDVIGSAVTGGLGGKVAGSGSKVALSTAARFAMRASIIAVIADVVASTIVDIGIKPTADKGTAGAQKAIDAKAVYESSKKTVADQQDYAKSLRDAKTGIQNSSKGISGEVLYGITDLTTRMKNWFSGKNQDDLSTAQQKVIAAIDAEAARVKAQTVAAKAAFDKTSAGKAALAAEAALRARPYPYVQALHPTLATGPTQVPFSRSATNAKAQGLEMLGFIPGGALSGKPVPLPKPETYTTAFGGTQLTALGIKQKAAIDKQQAELHKSVTDGLRETAVAAFFGAVRISHSINEGLQNYPGYGVIAASKLTSAIKVGTSSIPGLLTDSTKLPLGTTLYPSGVKTAKSLASGVTIGVAPIPGILGGAAHLPLGTTLQPAGVALAKSLAVGLGYGVKVVQPAVTTLAGTIKAMFGGSPVETGPLLAFNDGKIGIELANKLAYGLNKGAPTVSKAAQNLASSLAMNTSLQTAQNNWTSQGRGRGSTPNTGHAGASQPRPVTFHIGTVQDGDSLLRRARANDRMLSLAEGGDSTQLQGLGI